jgi:predicted acylesterase/phospholipase RssA
VGKFDAPTNIFQVVARAVSAAQKHQLESWERHADLVLRPDVQTLAWDAFDRAEEAIEAGEQAATSALPRIKKLIEPRTPPLETLQDAARLQLWNAESLR